MSPRQADAADFSVLLAEARGGNTTSLGLLLEKLRGSLAQLTRQGLAADLQSKADDGDLVQEALAVACRQFASFQGDSEQEFAAWLRTILRNVLRHFIRDFCNRGKRAGREVSLDSNPAAAAAARSLPSPGPSPVERALERELCHILYRAVDFLAPEEQWLLCARAWDGLGWEDIGAVLGISPDAARHRWGGVLRRLGDHLPIELFRAPPARAG